jgi:hypothetical protein
VIGMITRAIVALVTALLVLTVPPTARASNLVLPGFDLFHTLAGTSFPGLGPLVGVSIGTFDFGSGPTGVDGTDTIVHRLDPASAPATAISIEMVALQLMTAAPVDFLGFGLDDYFITLQSARGGPASVGRMTINFGPEAPPGSPHGTFDSFFDVFFDIRIGALDGPIVLSDSLLLTQTGGLWNHFPDPNELLIDGVNHLLNGQDESNDFQPLGVVNESHPNGAIHRARVTTIPAPSSLALCAFAVAVVAGQLWRSSRRRV